MRTDLEDVNAIVSSGRFIQTEIDRFERFETDSIDSAIDSTMNNLLILQ